MMIRLWFPPLVDSSLPRFCGRRKLLTCFLIVNTWVGSRTRRPRQSVRKVIRSVICILSSHNSTSLVCFFLLLQLLWSIFCKKQSKKWPESALKSLLTMDGSAGRLICVLISSTSATVAAIVAVTHGSLSKEETKSHIHSDLHSETWHTRR